MGKKPFIISIVILASLTGSAFAQAFELPKPGLTPDSPFYFLDTLGEKIGLFFTFGAEKKAEKALMHAEEKLAEAKAMAEENKTEAIERANQNYQESLSLANTKTQEAKKQGKDVEELAILITEKTLKHQETLVEVFEKVPEEAKVAIEKAIEVSRKGSEEAVQAVSGAKKEELLQKIEEMKVKTEEKIKALEEKIKGLEEKIKGLEEKLKGKEELPPEEKALPEVGVPIKEMGKEEIIKKEEVKVPEVGVPEKKEVVKEEVMVGENKVELATDTPAATAVAKGAQDVIFTKYNFCAASEAYTVSKIVITRTGISADTDLSHIKLYDGTTQIGSTQALSTLTHKATFSGLSWVIPANSCKVLTVKASIATGATTFNSIKLGISSLEDIIATITPTGTFPIWGNHYTVMGLESE